jgi:molecular chaperone DnaK
VQGERTMASDNKSLGRFNLDGIPPAPRGMPKIEVSFDIDANGILSVKAKDQTSGKEQSIRIEASSGLSDADVEKMRADADKNATEDKEKKDLAEAQNNAEQLVYMAEKSLKDYGDKVGEDVKKDVQEKIDALKSARGGTNADAIKSASDALSTSMQKIGEAMSKQPGGQSAPNDQKPPEEPKQ